MQIISNITTPKKPTFRNQPPGPHGASISHPGWSRTAMCLELQPRLVGQIGPSRWGRKTHGCDERIFWRCQKNVGWLPCVCICVYIDINIYVCIYLCIYVIIYLVIYVFICLCIYIYMCVCFHGKIDKYDDVWWFSRKPYLISGGDGTKWNVLVAIIQHQMQKKCTWTRTASVTSYYRFNKTESSPGKAVPLNQTCLGHIWTSCVWQAGYKS